MYKTVFSVKWRTDIFSCASSLQHIAFFDDLDKAKKFAIELVEQIKINASFSEKKYEDGSFLLSWTDYEKGEEVTLDDFYFLRDMRDKVALLGFETNMMFVNIEEFHRWTEHNNFIAIG